MKVQTGKGVQNLSDLINKFGRTHVEYRLREKKGNEKKRFKLIQNTSKNALTELGYTPRGVKKLQSRPLNRPLRHYIKNGTLHKIQHKGKSLLHDVKNRPSLPNISQSAATAGASLIAKRKLKKRMLEYKEIKKIYNSISSNSKGNKGEIIDPITYNKINPKNFVVIHPNVKHVFQKSTIDKLRNDVFPRLPKHPFTRDPISPYNILHYTGKRNALSAVPINMIKGKHETANMFDHMEKLSQAIKYSQNTLL